MGHVKGQKAEAEATLQSRSNDGAGRQEAFWTHRQPVQAFIAQMVVKTWTHNVAVNVCLPGLTKVGGEVGGAQQDGQAQEQEQTLLGPEQRLGCFLPPEVIFWPCSPGLG